MNTQLKEYAVNSSWQSQMDRSKGLDGWNNYSGGMDKPDWVVSLSRSRDSEIMDESNFQAALDLLGGPSKNVVVERFGHWACGWFELILVNPKSTKHVKIAFEIAERLRDYPILDENDFYERELEYQSDYAEGAKQDLAKAISTHFGLNVTRTLVSLAYDLNMECQAYYRNDSCIDIYECREPDKRDTDRLMTVMTEMSYRYEKSRTFKALMQKLNERA